MIQLTIASLEVLSQSCILSFAKVLANEPNCEKTVLGKISGILSNQIYFIQVNLWNSPIT